MDTPILHLVSPSRDGAPAMIVGDVAALTRLRAAIDTALNAGTGGTELFCSDGEPYDLLVVVPPSMHNVYTAYAGEVRPARSLRELVSMKQLCGLSSAPE